MEFTWEYLATIVGAGAVTALLVQMIKVISGTEIGKWWLRLMTYGIGTLLLLLGTYFTVGLTLQSTLLCIVNGVAVYFAATGEYHTAKKQDSTGVELEIETLDLNGVLKLFGIDLEDITSSGLSKIASMFGIDITSLSKKDDVAATYDTPSGTNDDASRETKEAEEKPPDAE